MLGDNVKKELDKFGRYLVTESRKNLTRKGKADTKRLYNSLDYDLEVFPNSFSFEFKMEDYGIFVDEGVRGAGGVRKTTSKFNSRNNKGKLWKIKGKNSRFKFGKSGGISPKHFAGWASRKGLSKFAVAKAVYHQGFDKTEFYSRPFDLGFARLPDDILDAFALDVDEFLEMSLK